VWRTDGRTDGRTDRFAIAYSALSMLSRAKNTHKNPDSAHPGHSNLTTRQHLAWVHADIPSVLYHRDLRHNWVALAFFDIPAMLLPSICWNCFDENAFSMKADGLMLRPKPYKVTWIAYWKLEMETIALTPPCPTESDDCINSSFTRSGKLRIPHALHTTHIFSTKFGCVHFWHCQNFKINFKFLPET